LTTSVFNVCFYDKGAPIPATPRHLHPSHASQSSLWNQWNWPDLKQHTNAAAESKFYGFSSCLNLTTIVTVTANGQQYESSNAVALVGPSLNIASTFNYNISPACFSLNSHSNGGCKRCKSAETILHLDLRLGSMECSAK
jgi:hypothetical protein